MDKETFSKLLEDSESRVIDFKQQMYELDNDDRENSKLAKLVKDVISFSNTVRTESSYIIIGAKKNDENNSVELVGINKNINESILQQKVKDKIFPIPHFNYFTITYEGLVFGVFEFPIFKYEMPLSPTINMKGLIAGKFYYRKGSSNDEAIGAIGIHINNWLTSLPTITEERTLSGSIATLLGKACNIDNKLSILIGEALSIANKYQLKPLNEFCLNEITGLSGKSGDNHGYRINKVGFCANKVDEINPRATSLQIKNYLKQEGNYWEYNMLFTDSIANLENLLNGTQNQKGMVKINSTTKSLGIDMKEMDITYLIFHENYLMLYNSIRQKFISLLVEINMN